MPTEFQERLLDAEADKQAEIDELVETRAEQAEQRLLELLLFADDRDLEIFAELGADPALVAGDYHAIPVIDRGPDWVAGFSAMWGAAKMQVYAELFARDIIGIAEREGMHAQELAGNMNRSELVEVGKVGIGRDRFRAAKERRKNGDSGDRKSD